MGRPPSCSCFCEDQSSSLSVSSGSSGQQIPLDDSVCAYPYRLTCGLPTNFAAQFTAPTGSPFEFLNGVHDLEGRFHGDGIHLVIDESSCFSFFGLVPCFGETDFRSLFPDFFPGLSNGSRFIYFGDVLRTFYDPDPGLQTKEICWNAEQGIGEYLLSGIDYQLTFKLAAFIPQTGPSADRRLLVLSADLSGLICRHATFLDCSPRSIRYFTWFKEISDMNCDDPLTLDLWDGRVQPCGICFRDDVPHVTVTPSARRWIWP